LRLQDVRGGIETHFGADGTTNLSEQFQPPSGFVLPSAPESERPASAGLPHTFSMPPPPQVSGNAHRPQDAMACQWPQRSTMNELPQSIPAAAHSSASVSGVQALHTFWRHNGVGSLHVPHEATERLRLQLSKPPNAPQVLPSRAQNSRSDSGRHTQTLRWQTDVAPLHVPHDSTVRAVAQLSAPETAPQLRPSRVQKAVSVSAAHAQTFGVPPPPQDVPEPKHDPHDATMRAAPQLSVAEMLPQFLPSREHSA
jgi:hypothetical protein